MEATSIALVIIGILLLLVEAFVPGGLIGTFGGILIGVSVVMGFTVSSVFGLILLISAIIAGFIIFWLWFKYFPNSPVGRRVILQEDASDWHGYDQHQSELLEKTGTAKTPLHPTGIANIEGKRVDVVTRGELIAAGTRLKVIEVAGNRIVVTQDKTTPEKAE